jgi:hypothetical protein
MAVDLEHGDVVAYVAYGNDEGERRITFRYRDDSTETFDAGLPVDEGTAGVVPVWWR